MKIHEYNEMMRYLTRPGKVLANNINNKKISNTDERTALKRGGSDTKVMSKDSKMLQYINDHNIVYGDKKATKTEIEDATKRIEARPKEMSYQDEYKLLYGKEPKKVAKKIPVIPPKPDMVNGHSDWNTEDWLESIDPSWWLPEDRRRTGILEFELADEYWQEQYQIYLDGGGTLDFKNFMQQQNNMKVSKKINKIAEEKKDSEGIASILALHPGRRI